MSQQRRLVPASGSYLGTAGRCPAENQVLELSRYHSSPECTLASGRDLVWESCLPWLRSLATQPAGVRVAYLVLQHIVRST